MNWFSKLFKKKTNKQADWDLIEGSNAFKAGEKLWQASFIYSETGEPTSYMGRDKAKGIKALHFLDIAIKKGIDNSEVFSIRGSILLELEFYFEALEDYDKAILRNPKQGIAANYYTRSIIKESIFDFDGSIADVNEAIRLSKLDNHDNKFWNNHYQKIGYQTATEAYESALSFTVRQMKNQSPSDRDNKLKTIKRRENQPLTSL